MRGEEPLACLRVRYVRYSILGDETQWYWPKWLINSHRFSHYTAEGSDTMDQ
jgi:hypothetical protein